MLSLCNIRFMNKVEGLFDGVDAPQITLRVILDEDFIFPPMEGNTDRNITDWGNTQLPPVQLSASIRDVKIEFAIYKDGGLIGRGFNTVPKGQMRNDALDTYDAEGNITGKLVYELYWVKKGQQGSYITKEQFAGAKGKTMNEGGHDRVVKAAVPTSKKKTYVRQAGDEDCGGLCGCFAVRKSKKKKGESERQTQQNQKEKDYGRVKQERPIPIKVATATPTVPSPSAQKKEDNISTLTDFKHTPYIYKESQLEAGKPFNQPVEPKRLVHYSKAFYQC